MIISIYRARKKIWHGVWTLVLLLYSPLVYTCVMLLKCPRIPDTEGKNNVAVSYNTFHAQA